MRKRAREGSGVPLPCERCGVGRFPLASCCCYRFHTFLQRVSERDAALLTTENKRHSRSPDSRPSSSLVWRALGFRLTNSTVSLRATSRPCHSYDGMIFAHRCKSFYFPLVFTPLSALSVSSVPSRLVAIINIGMISRKGRFRFFYIF